jgi:RNA polymerase sigma-70 factor (ECF subfamily)
MRAVTATEQRAVAPADEELLARLRRGDRAAMDELFQRYRIAAYRVAYRLLGHEADALDAVQNAFIKVFTHLDGFEGRSSFKTWLLRVVSNAALDLGRRRGRRDELCGEERGADVEPEAPAADEEPGRELERADLRRLLDDALRQLPESQRKTFILHVDGGLSYREVADVLDISIGTVMSRLFYARQKLRTLLSERWQR